MKYNLYEILYVSTTFSEDNCSLKNFVSLMTDNDSTKLLLNTFTMQNNVEAFAEVINEEDNLQYLTQTNYKLMYFFFLVDFF